MTTDEWVRRVNRLAYEIYETAGTLHPSAWSEQVGPLLRKYERLAKVMPDDEATPKKKSRRTE